MLNFKVLSIFYEIIDIEIISSSYSALLLSYYSNTITCLIPLFHQETTISETIWNIHAPGPPLTKSFFMDPNIAFLITITHNF